MNVRPRFIRRILAVALCGASLSALAAEPGQWAASWGTALVLAGAKAALHDDERANITLRQVLRLSLGGRALRVKVSNLYGSEQLVIGAATVARGAAGSPALAGPPLSLRFGGAPGVTLAPGQELLSDAIDMETASGTDLAISLFAKSAPSLQSIHTAAHATQFIGTGDQTNATDFNAVRRVTSWFQLAGVEVLPAAAAPVVVAIGDSITDGTGSTTDGNDRWPDALQGRLAQAHTPAAVIDAGIGGNRMLREDTGPPVAKRFDHDVLERAGVTHAVVLIGVNDLGRLHRGSAETPETRAEMLQDLKSTWQDLVRRAHALGVCVIAGTLTPYGDSRLYRPQPYNEDDRQALNQWIRSSPLFDGVADFDAAVRDPAAGNKLQPAFDSGDHLHLSPEGYKAMAGAVPLDRLERCPP